MTDIAVLQFQGVGLDRSGRNMRSLSEPPVSRTVIQSVGPATSQYIAVQTGCNIAACYASSGGGRIWYNVFASVNTASNVVSGGFPERALSLVAEGDYEIISLPVAGQLVFRGG